MKRPSLRSILLGAIPFVATCFSVSLWDRIYPMVFGIPFNFFWVISWMVLTPVCLWGAYRIETRREGGSGVEAGGAD
ncbi:MAG: DUF3311 domain-containing protein [Candidatus Acidiferrales bacterium]